MTKNVLNEMRVELEKTKSENLKHFLQLIKLLKRLEILKMKIRL